MLREDNRNLSVIVTTVRFYFLFYASFFFLVTFFLIYFTLSYVTLLSHGSHVQSHDGSPDLSHDEGT